MGIKTKPFARLSAERPLSPASTTAGFFTSAGALVVDFLNEGSFGLALGALKKPVSAFAAAADAAAADAEAAAAPVEWFPNRMKSGSRDVFYHEQDEGAGAGGGLEFEC